MCRITHMGRRTTWDGADWLAPNPDGAYALYRVGDAVASRNVHAAIYDSSRSCVAI